MTSPYGRVAFTASLPGNQIFKRLDLPDSEILPVDVLMKSEPANMVTIDAL
jgi:hypothetical protein